MFEEYFSWVPGIRFENTFSPSHWTVPAHASLYTGYYPSEIDVHGKAPSLDCSKPVLAEKFHDTGFHTRLISANPNIVYHDGWTRGFEEVKTPYDLAIPNGVFDWPNFLKSTDGFGLSLYAEGVKRCIMGDSATLPSLRFAATLKRQGGIDSLLDDDGAQVIYTYLNEQRFADDELLVVNLMEAHTPYNPPDEYNTAGEAVGVDFGQAVAGDVEDDQFVRQGYEDAVRYLADTYRDIFEELERAFEFVFTLSDHGECLGEHGMWNHGYGLYPELVHVPLVVSGPSIDSTELRSDPVTFLDIFQTACDLAEIGAESRGVNVLEEERTESILTEYHGLLSWHFDQLNRYEIPQRKVERYDVPLNGIANASGAYGYETHNSEFVASEELGSVLLEDMDRLRAHIGPMSLSEEDHTVSPEVEEQLRGLGYM